MLRRVKRLLIGVLVGILVLAGVAWVLSLTLGIREKLYAGKPTDYWQLACLSTNEAERAQAIVVLNAQILPDLTNTMFHDWHDSEFKMKLIEVLDGLPEIQIPYVAAPGRRAGAAAALGDFGPPAAAAIPALIQALNGSDPAVRGSAAVALGKIHSDPDVVIPMLMPYLNNPDFAEPAVVGLGGFGPAAKSAVPELLALLESPDHQLQKAVYYALKSIDPDALMAAVLNMQAREDQAAAAEAAAANPSGAPQESTHSTPAVNPSR